ncbi:hypothetical protein DPX16_21928 [Anabarilius grahami]|uniref:Uncharacterized protein n=1 Tax=Anabarilius grahami TaxID=495550 RepID=A0A3N0XNA2_ANAGA|nr:hypothetical protein DPX16_21928 [Anabarilius grahami]
METTTPEPPADGELPPAARMEPATTAPTKAPEPKFPSSADQVDPVAQPPASDPLVPPRTVDRWASPCLLPPSAPPETLDHEAAPGSPVPSARPCSVVNLAPWTYEPSAALRLSTPTAAVGSSFPPDSPRSTVAQAPLQVSGARMSPRAFITVAPPRSPVPAALLCPISSPSLPGDPLRSAQSPLVVPRRSSTTPIHWLLPPSTPPWAVFITVLWVAPPVFAPMDAPSIKSSMESLPIGLPVSSSPLTALSPQPFSSSSPTSKASTLPPSLFNLSCFCYGTSLAHNSQSAVWMAVAPSRHSGAECVVTAV